MEKNTKEKCGVFGVIGSITNNIDNILTSLSKIQHRGRESFGLCFKTNEKLYQNHTLINFWSNIHLL